MLRFGKYELIKKIAVGGMGEIFEARTVGIEGFEKPLAVKRIFPHLGEDDTYRRRFVREAKVMARLVHPNIVQVYDLGEQDGQLFIAMEYVEGPDLSHLLLQLRDLDRALGFPIVGVLAFDLLEALDFAHTLTDATTGERLALVHRDVSPHNILVSNTTGLVKLCDFGIVRATGAASDTLDGVVVGKVRYMAPEQALGKPLDGRADLFSLGAVLFEACTGRQLYPERNPHELLRAVTRGSVPAIESLVPDIPDLLADAIHGALHADPADRYSSADEFRMAIEKYLVTCSLRRARQGLRDLAIDCADTVVMPMSPSRASPREEPTSRWQMLVRGTDPGLDEERGTEATVTQPFDPPAERAPWLLYVVLLIAVAVGVAVVWNRTREQPVPVAETTLTPPPVTSHVQPPEERDLPTGSSESATTPASTPEPPADAPRTADRRSRKRKARGGVGYLTLHMTPWANITIDGVRLEKTTPLRKHPLPAGRHTVILEGPEGRQKTITVHIHGGQTVTKILRYE